MTEFPEYDDVGSFPLPVNIDKDTHNKFYWIAYRALFNNQNIFENKGIALHFINPINESLQLKINAGVEVINFPQLMDMHTQFLRPINDFEIEPGLVDNNKALIAEIPVIHEFAKRFFEENGRAIKIKLCVTRPLELYFRRLGFTVYLDMALNFSKSVNRFFKNSILNNKYIQTDLISIDEPSLGYVDIFNVNDDEIIKIYEKSLEGVKTNEITSQIHIHTLNRADIPLNAKNIDVITCEYASNKSNKISKNLLEEHDKFIRVGITRTNVDNLIAEAIDNGKKWDFLKTNEGMRSLIDPKERIQKNLNDAIQMYGNRLKYIGPDCGLGGWRIPEIAFELLQRTHSVIESFKKL